MEEKITFELEGFEKEWQEAIKDADKEYVDKLTEEDKEFARGYYRALVEVEASIYSVMDEAEAEESLSGTLNKIKQEIIENAGERIKERMLDEFYDVVEWMIEEKID